MEKEHHSEDQLTLSNNPQLGEIVNVLETMGRSLTDVIQLARATDKDYRADRRAMQAAMALISVVLSVVIWVLLDKNRQLDATLEMAQKTQVQIARIATLNETMSEELKRQAAVQEKLMVIILEMLKEKKR